MVTKKELDDLMKSVKNLGENAEKAVREQGGSGGEQGSGGSGTTRYSVRTDPYKDLELARQLAADGKYDEAKQIAEGAKSAFHNSGKHEFDSYIDNLSKDWMYEKSLKEKKAEWGGSVVKSLKDKARQLELEKHNLVAGRISVGSLGKYGTDGYTRADQYDKELARLNEHVKKREEAEKAILKTETENKFKKGWLRQDVSSLEKELEKLEQEKAMCIASGDTEGAEEAEAKISVLKEHTDKRKKAEEDHLNRHIKGHWLIGTEHGKTGKGSKLGEYLGFLGFGEEPFLGIIINGFALFFTFIIAVYKIISPLAETFNFFIPFLSILQYPIDIIAIIILYPFIKAIFHPFKEDFYSLFEHHVKKEVKKKRQESVEELEEEETQDEEEDEDTQSAIEEEETQDEEEDEDTQSAR